MSCFRPLLGQTSRTGPNSNRRRARLSLEGLETRLAPASVFVVPLSQPLDSVHFHDLSKAILAAGTNGLVTIEPGTTPDALQPVTVATAMTIQGDPNLPASIL